MTEPYRISPEPPAEPRPAPRRVEPPRLAAASGGRRWALLEFVAYFLIGFSVMNFIYLHPAGLPWNQLGAPDHDGFYHIKMAVLMPSIGLVREFPWLQHVWFTQYDSSFISHHYGFHALLMPFVHGAKALGYDYLTGGRWAISTFFGLNLALLMGLLASERIRWRWLWLLVFLVLPLEFFWRHSYVRAIAPSLTFMLLLVWAMFRNRPVLAGLATAAYTHLYLGSVVYSPLIVGCYVAGCMMGPRGDRRIPWSMILWTALGWLVGLRTYPYFGGALEFLRMQILGSGLDPDIPVGSEWGSYGNVWDFAVRLCGPMLAVWAACLTLRLRLGGRLNAKEAALVLMNFAFLLLTLKARRFIEYWPAFCLLSSIFLAAPLVNRLAEWFDGERAARAPREAAWMRTAAPVLAGVGLTAVLWLVTGPVLTHAILKPIGGLLKVDTFWIESPIWILAATLLLAAYLAPIWIDGLPSHAGRRVMFGRIAAAALFVAAFAGVLALVARHGLTGVAVRPSQLGFGWIGWVGAVVLFVVVGVARRVGHAHHALALRPSGATGVATVTTARRVARSVGVIGVGLAVFSGAVLMGSQRLVALQRDVGSPFNLPAVRDALTYLQQVSQPGDIVFTDDWDCFPVYFYYNAHNRYIVGLDPKFTQGREPELWERYVRISRGQVPRTYQATWTGPDGEQVRRELHVELSDIRERFLCKYVITDSDHTLLARKLSEAPDFAELIYPRTKYAECINAPYLIFRIKDGGGTSSPTPPPADGSLSLGDLKPKFVQQGWGELTADRSVEGEPIHLGEHFYERGLGTHAPLELTYTIPEGFAAFEAIVGLNRVCAEHGSVVVSVELDGREVYRSPLLRGGDPPVTLRVPLEGAEYLTLRADPTDDGNRWDHVDWGNARLTKAQRSPVGP